MRARVGWQVLRLRCASLRVTEFGGGVEESGRLLSQTMPTLGAKDAPKMGHPVRVA